MKTNIYMSIIKSKTEGRVVMNKLRHDSGMGGDNQEFTQGLGFGQLDT